MPESSSDRPPSRGRTITSAELAPLASLLTVLFLWSLAPLAGFDFWYYLAVGRDILRSGSIPWAQTFLGTTSVYGFGKHADAAWLSYLLTYLVYLAGGFLGLALLKSALLTGTTAVVYWCNRRLGMAPFWAAAWSALGLWSIRGRFEMRSYLFTDLCLALLVAILIQAEQGRRTRRLALELAFLFAIWSNLHQGILAGFVVIGCWTLFGRRTWKERVGLSALALSCSMLKPHALNFPAFLYDHFANSSAIEGVIEWAAPGWDILLFQTGLFYATLATAVAVRARRGWKAGLLPPWSFGLTALFFAALAARSIRSISELLPVVCPLAAAYFPPLPDNLRLRAVVALLMGSLLWSTYPGWQPDDLKVAKGYPDALVAALPRSDGKEHQIFNSFEFGNFLIFRDVPPFLHGMTSLYKEQLITDFQSVLNPTPRRWEILKRFKVDSALLHHPTDQDATLDLVETLSRSPEWKLELWDDSGLLFLRGEREEGLTEVQPWRSPAWTDESEAEAELTRLLSRRPSALAHLLLSQILLKRGDLEQALVQAKASVGLSPAFYPGWVQLGLCYARLDDPQGVKLASEQGVRAAPSVAAARFNLGLALLQQAQREPQPLSNWHRLQASYQARRALWLDPGFTPARQLLEALR